MPNEPTTIDPPYGSESFARRLGPGSRRSREPGWCTSKHRRNTTRAKNYTLHNTQLPSTAALLPSSLPLPGSHAAEPLYCAPQHQNPPMVSNLVLWIDRIRRQLCQHVAKALRTPTSVAENQNFGTQCYSKAAQPSPQARAVLGRLSKRLGDNDGSVSVRPPSAAIWLKLRGFPRWNQGLKRWTETLMEHTMNNIDDWVYAHGDCRFNWESARCRGRCGGTANGDTNNLAYILRCCVLGPSNKGFAAAERMVPHQARLRGEIYRASAVHSGRQHLSAGVSALSRCINWIPNIVHGKRSFERTGQEASA
jgi:hypothetical protein